MYCVNRQSISKDTSSHYSLIWPSCIEILNWLQVIGQGCCSAINKIPRVPVVIYIKLHALNSSFFKHLLNIYISPLTLQPAHMISISHSETRPTLGSAEYDSHLMLMAYKYSSRVPSFLVGKIMRRYMAAVNMW